MNKFDYWIFWIGIVILLIGYWEFVYGRQIARLLHLLLHRLKQEEKEREKEYE